MSIIVKLDEILKRVVEIGYWKLPIPSNIDTDIINCIKSYQSLPKDKQMSLRDSINMDIARLLLYFSERMATFALRTRDQDVFQLGLLALDLINGQEYLREILFVMPLFYDASKRSKLSFEKVPYQNDDFANFIEDFLSRDEEDKSLECMGYILTKDEDNNLTYQRTW
jgi:hypothetical protein